MEEIDEEKLEEASRLDDVVRTFLNVLSSGRDFDVSPGMLKRLFRELWGWKVRLIPPNQQENESIEFTLGEGDSDESTE